MRQQESLVKQPSAESFVNVESKLKNKKFSFNGFLELKSADIKQAGDIPIRGDLDYDEYIVFNTNTGSTVIIPAYKYDKNHSFVLDWTDVDSFADLCGKSVPVESIDEKTDKENVYKPATNILKEEYIKDINQAEILVEDDYLNYDLQHENWELKDSFTSNIKLSLLLIFTFSYFLVSLISNIINMPIEPQTFAFNFLVSAILSIAIVYVTDAVDIWGYPVYRVSHKILKHW